MVVNASFWQGKKVLVTGHTGFKGSWLCLWLQQMNAELIGFSLAPNTEPNLFEKASVADNMKSIEGDIRTPDEILNICLKEQPEIIIHMAAQALVRYSYSNPIETYQTNVMGSLHILEAAKQCKSVKSIVMVTTDKCYENKEWVWAYRENDRLGGHDPYSSSKACMELLVDSYRKSYLLGQHKCAVATARAGNVIGGGDWSQDRLIPDIIKSFTAQVSVSIRSPYSIRPWQHVLEPLSGYLLLAEKLYKEGGSYAEAWNFGPALEDAKNVEYIVTTLAAYWGDSQWVIDNTEQLKESKVLKLDCTKAYEKLAWKGRWDINKSLERTVEWYQAEKKGMDMRQVCYEQIAEYIKEY